MNKANELLPENEFLKKKKNSYKTHKIVAAVHPTTFPEQSKSFNNPIKTRHPRIQQTKQTFFKMEQAFTYEEKYIY